MFKTGPILKKKINASNKISDLNPHQCHDVVEPLTDIEKAELKKRICKCITEIRQQKKKT
jgi:hypothetical protein